MTQLAMTWSPPPPKQRPSITERFEAFHAANPHVLEEMLRLARQHVAEGATRIGAKQLWEELRLSLRVNKLGEYRLDNSLTSLYARAIVEADPTLAPMFELRTRRAK
jgi:hypothetical protein